MVRPVKFNRKAFFSFLVLFVWIILILTGIVLYFSPPGRVANWVEWRFLGLTKEGWQSVHTVFSFSFILFGAYHLYYNWTVFWSYIKLRVQEGIRMRRELVSSGLLVSVILVMVILGLQPFKAVVDFGDYLSNSWSSESTEPPLPHAELLSLSEYAQKTGQDVDQLVRSLEKAGIQRVDSGMKLETLAELNHVSPKELVEKIQSSHENSIPPIAGYGRRTVPDIADELGISAETARQRLNKVKISFRNDELIKDIAERNDIRPLDVVKIINGENISAEE